MSRKFCFLLMENGIKQEKRIETKEKKRTIKKIKSADDRSRLWELENKYTSICCEFEPKIIFLRLRAEGLILRGGVWQGNCLLTN